jgi:Fic family protein
MVDHPRQMEPLMPEAHQAELSRLTCAILSKSGELRGQVHSPAVREEVARLIREMNCYYSNLIEGHKTRPRELELAKQQQFSRTPSTRENQELSIAHLRTQEALEDRVLAEPSWDVYSPACIAWIHQHFYQHLSDHLQWAKTRGGKAFRIHPGCWRDYMVDVGRHTPPHFSQLPVFLDRIHRVYGTSEILEAHRLTAIAAAHHRLGWIHPFGDGNGRVMRLHSHALLVRHHLEGYGLWTISRGLARNRSEYYRRLGNADQSRSSDVDGRGNLTDKGLADFCVFFLRVMLDQIEFMGNLLDLPTLRERVKRTFHYEYIHLGKDAEPLQRIV